jgi:uncharacterized protein (DUF302 family)
MDLILNPGDDGRGGTDMLISIDTRKPLDRIREDLPAACAARKFGVLGVHDLKAKMAEKGVSYSGDCLVFEVCNPHQAKKVLEANPDVSTALPCRISAYTTPDGRTKLATLRPTALIDLFKTREMREVACEVEETLHAIMKEAAGSA